MKEFLQSVFKTTEERIKNPFIGAFTTSWALFNWKPILFIILSSKNIEDKIKFIDENFFVIKNILWYPLIAAIFYIIILPYISLFFDYLLKYSLLKRNDILVSRQKQNIENHKLLAIEEIKLEEAKTEFRERSSHNKLVEDLQKRNNDLETEIQNEKEQNRTIVEELKSELLSRDQMTNEELRHFEKRYSESRKEISELNSKLFEKDQEIQSLKMTLSHRGVGENKNIYSGIINFQNGPRVLERFDGNKLQYYNLETNEQYPEEHIRMLKERHLFEREGIKPFQTSSTR